MKNDYYLDITGLPKELRFLLSLLKVNDKEDMTQYDFAEFDWGLFLSLAIHHRLYPPIYLKVKKLNGEFVPLHVVQSLKQMYQSNTFQMLHLSGEMEKISNRFMENRIRTLFLKGPALAYELYGDISQRTSCDLDLLVQVNDLKKVDELLLNEGYIKDDYIHTVLNDWKWRHHHVTYFHASKKIKLEIHWRLNPGPSKEPSFNELWDRKCLSSLTTAPAYILGQEDLFLFLVLHGARHGWSRLRWLADIRQLVEKKLNGSKLRTLIKDYQCLHICGQSFILASQLLGAPIPKEIQLFKTRARSRKLAQDALFYMKQMVSLHTDPIPEEVALYHKRHLFSLMAGRQKVIFILSFLYPYPRDAETLPLPKSLHFLYFPLRPFLLVWRKTRKQVLP